MLGSTNGKSGRNENEVPVEGRVLADEGKELSRAACDWPYDSSQVSASAKCASQRCVMHLCKALIMTIAYTRTPLGCDTA